MLHSRRNIRKDVLHKEFFDQQKCAIIKPPENEVPRRSVPESGQKPYDEDVPDIGQCAAAIAAQRNVNIVSESAPQRNMPSSPEFRDGFGAIGIVKILFNFKAEHFCNANCHVRIAAEIHVDQ